MLFKELMPDVTEALGNINIKGVTNDSRKVQSGWAFVCVNGALADGHNFVKSALENGAAVVVAERDVGAPCQVIVADTHKVYAEMCAAWFQNPAKSLKIIGVTGTNGKTSVTYMIKSILEHNGEKVGLIGTIQNMIGDQIIESKNTTPGVYELQELFAKMKTAGCKYVIMEVSSHALDQRRVEGLEFSVGIFTNLTQDHLDYHITMENYMLAKRKLFENSKISIVNFDDEYSEKITSGLSSEKVTYSAKSDDATYTAKNINYRTDGVDYEFVGFGTISRIKLSTGGRFSVYNSMCAVIAAIKLGFSAASAAAALSAINGVKGRAEVVPTGKDFTVIIDYAHTPDGLENILKTFKECKKNRLVVLFGCGGDRDKTKRPIMGKIATEYADFSIVTSDNPRTENPSAIIEDILAGITDKKASYKVIENRKEAIEYAIKTAQKDDVIVLAGKGHETYQILGRETIHFDEREVIAEVLSSLEK